MKADTTIGLALVLALGAYAYEAKAEVITSTGYKVGAGARQSQFNGKWYTAGAYESNVGDLFCVEIEQNFTFKRPTEYSVSKLVPDEIQSLFNDYFDGTRTGWFQTKLWELTNPIGYTLTSAPVTLTKNATPIRWDLTLYTSATHQDLIGYKPAPVPLPCAPMLFGSGLLALFGYLKINKGI